MKRRARNGKGSLGRDFTPLYEHVMRTEAVRTLPLSAFKLWAVAVALCKPWNNGAVPLTRSALQSFGLVNSQAIDAGIAQLVARGLIVRTRKGGSRRAALFGVAHLPLNHNAMKKAGAREPQRSPTDSQSNNTDCSSVQKRTDGQSTNGASVGFSDCSSVHKPPKSPILRPDHQAHLRSMPMPTPEIAPMPEHLVALLKRIEEHGGTVTAADHLRVRWWRGDPPADLAGELKLRAAELYRYMGARTGEYLL